MKIRSASNVSIFAPFEKYKVHTSFIRIDVKPCNDLLDLFCIFPIPKNNFRKIWKFMAHCVLK